MACFDISKRIKFSFFTNIGILALIVSIFSCSKSETNQTLVKAEMIPFFSIGDSLRNDKNTSQEQIQINIDSNSNYVIKLESSHFSNTTSVAYFVKFQIGMNDKYRILDSLQFGGYVFKGPILTVFSKGDSVDYDISKTGFLDWFPKSDVQLGNTGWIKHHIYTSTQGKNLENVKTGDNYIVIKFGEIGNERLAWMNVFYQDSLVYIKEAYYNSEAQKGIKVGYK